jgi:hypothetical protein
MHGKGFRVSEPNPNRETLHDFRKDSCLDTKHGVMRLLYIAIYNTEFYKMITQLLTLYWTRS